MSCGQWNETNTAAETVSQVQSLLAGSWPLDSYIFDMQWHMTPDWGGYAWDQSRYGPSANVTALLAWLHDLGLTTGMNLHDDDGTLALLALRDGSGNGSVPLHMLWRVDACMQCVVQHSAACRPLLSCRCRREAQRES